MKSTAMAQTRPLRTVTHTDRAPSLAKESARPTAMTKA